MLAVSLSVRARGAWSQWLSQRDWDLFVTLTSKRRAHPEGMHKSFRYYVHQISNDVYGRARTRRGCPIEYVNGIERHKSGWPHSHALLRLPGVDLDDPLQLSLAKWQKIICEELGWCRLDRPRHQAEVVSYVTDYVVKEGDLVLSENLSPATDPNPPLGLVGSQHGRSRAARGVAAAARRPPDHASPVGGSGEPLVVR